MWIKFLIGIMLTSQALAWRLTQDFENGFYWQNLPISITVIDSNPTRKAKIEQLSATAIDEWEDITQLDLWNKTGEGTPNIIRWSDNFQAETNMDPTSVLAVAIRYTGGPWFARTEVVINGSHYLNQRDSHLLTTITHELGHTMGLDHSEDYEAIMAPTLQNSFHMSLDDRDGMIDVYSKTMERQRTGYVSPLAYEEEETKNALSCGTVAPATAPANTYLSLVLGILIGFVRKIWNWFKSLL